MTDVTQDNWILYDGDCPFCQSYVTLARLREVMGPVRVVDARLGGPELQYLTAQGLNINDGMAMMYNGQLSHGAECIMQISVLSSRSRLFNRFMAAIFASPKRARLIYPWLKAGRNLALKVLGRRQIPV